METRECHVGEKEHAGEPVERCVLRKGGNILVPYEKSTYEVLVFTQSSR